MEPISLFALVGITLLIVMGLVGATLEVLTGRWSLAYLARVIDLAMRCGWSLAAGAILWLLGSWFGVPMPLTTAILLCFGFSVFCCSRAFFTLDEAKLFTDEGAVELSLALDAPLAFLAVGALIHFSGLA